MVMHRLDYPKGSMMVMPGIGDTYMDGTKNRLTRQTCLRSIFADCPPAMA
jgi:hypothetical protein